MRLLSFDTSSRGLSVAIVEDGRVLAQVNTDQAGSQAKADRQEAVSLLMPTIDQLTRDLQLKKSEFDAIVVGIGPGGFTGVRVGVVTARTLGQALGLPVFGVNSLEVLAYEVLVGVLAAQSDASASPLCTVIKEASKTHCFIASYQACKFDQGAINDSPSVFNDDAAAPLFALREWKAPAYLPDPLNFDEADICYVEASLTARVEHFGVKPGQINLLPHVNNVAVCQAKIAHVRYSLSPGETLLAQYSYRLLKPLYLRGASVTLKKGDVIERVETH